MFVRHLLSHKLGYEYNCNPNEAEIGKEGCKDVGSWRHSQAPGGGQRKDSTGQNWFGVREGSCNKGWITVSELHYRLESLSVR